VEKYLPKVTESGMIVGKYNCFGEEVAESSECSTIQEVYNAI
jgi:hypothetical protein